VAEWFPKRERGWAVALFESGGCVGAAIAPILVLWLYDTFGGWRNAFVVTGSLGFLWLIAWRLLYQPPEKHKLIRESEREMILKDKSDVVEESPRSTTDSWSQLLKLRQTWELSLAGFH